MGNQPGAERKGSKKAHKKSKKEKDLTIDELDNVIPFIERNVALYENRIKSLEGGRWDKEYGAITDGQGASFKCSESPENQPKNRYKNIVAYDHSRVTVTPNSENMNSDYINANWLAGPWGSKSYIACQGPVPDAFFSFWQMIWEYNCEIIVMLTNEVEGGRLKCHRYWPEPNAPVKVGSFTLKLMSEKPKATFVTRKIDVTFQGTTRTVTQFQYTAWPDHGVPNTTADMLSFRKVVHRELNLQSPCVVHCSAGVGRSGTFIALETLMTRAENLVDDLEPLSVVREMRRDRNYMVQTVDQYQFIFRAMLDALNKSLQRSRRAAKKRLREQQKASKQQEAEAEMAEEEELEELEEDIQEATGASEGFTAVNDDIVEGFKTLGRRAGNRASVVDASYSHYTLESDYPVMSAVPRDVRVQSLAASAQEDSWLARGNVDTTVEGKGYKVEETVGLETRLMSLQGSAHPDAWKQKFQAVQDAWVSETYDTRASLNPIESRVASLAQQEENWSYRSGAYRKAAEEDMKVILASLTQRLDSLAIAVAAMEKTKFSRDEPTVRDVTLRERLDALKDSSAVKRAPREGRVVEDPRKVAHRMQMEAERKKHEEAERLRREEEAKQNAMPKEPAWRTQKSPPKPTEPPVKEEKKEAAPIPLPEYQLKSPETKEVIHPMIAQAMQTKQLSNPKLK